MELFPFNVNGGLAIIWPLMSILEIILISLALAADAFAVAISSGFSVQKLRMRDALKIALWFGTFQSLMPAIGWLAGVGLRGFISGIDHWIAFVLLCFVGVKMMVEAFELEKKEKQANPFDTEVLVVLAVATSIDALATGVVFAIKGVAVLWPIVSIGIITFVVSFSGAWIGRMGGHFFEKKIEIMAGLILVGIGVKILIEHTCT
jgi:putative Mn2+ efflux pump MntP